ncbi:hypothetical protein Ciccas_009081, partial [Cichlidogyrus casuarinus]
TCLAEEKKILLKDLTEFFDAQPNVDIKSKSKDEYLLKMESEMDSATKKQINRLTQSRSLFTFETLLKDNLFNMEKRLLKRFQEEASNLGDDEDKKNNVFKELFRREKQTYLEEAELTLDNWEKTSVKNYLEEKLHLRFASFKCQITILNKYKDFDCHAPRPRPKFRYDVMNHFKAGVASITTMKGVVYWLSDAQKAKAIEKFVEQTESVIKRRVHAFLESRDFSCCGVCETTIDEIIKEIYVSTKQCKQQNMEIGHYLTKSFDRDFCYYMAFEVFAKKLCDIQSDFLLKNNPSEIIDKVKPKMREIFENFCQGQSHLKTICKELSESLKKSANAELSKLKQTLLREIFQSHPYLSTDVTKEKLIDKVLLSWIENNFDEDLVFDLLLSFDDYPDHSIRGYIRKKIQEQSKILEEKVEIEKQSIERNIRRALKEAEIDVPSENVILLNSWLTKFTKQVSTSFKLKEDDLNCFKDFDISKMADFNVEVSKTVLKFLEDFHEQSNGIESQLLGEMTRELVKTKFRKTLP